jgi:hypothetical protein
MSNRKYLPTFAELVDRLSICILKSIFIPENKQAYTKEIEDICSDVDSIINEKNVKLSSKLVKAIQMVMLSNRYIWENESKVRNGSDQDVGLLKLTHSINGVRNTAKNVVSIELGERKDLKTDCLAAELKSDFQNWENIL